MQTGMQESEIKIQSVKNIFRRSVFFFVYNNIIILGSRLSSLYHTIYKKKLNTYTIIELKINVQGLLRYFLLTLSTTALDQPLSRISINSPGIIVIHPLIKEENPNLQTL